MSTKTYVHDYFSPVVGWLELRVSDTGVRSISFISPPSSVRKRDGHPIMNRLIEQLDRYFSGDLTAFTVPVDVDTGTPFQRKVWEELTRIPYGETRSYADLAAAIGSPRAARAVGSANGENPVPILIPCHRVVKADGALGGFSSGTHIKQALLKLEGVRVRSSSNAH
ncbi:MAG: methylated-DNA--[protein]-cysteine S-methyltransferase [Desulfomonile sp.]|nr:methylated-DNA--[protein]-cysteine S-methyltransferase [Desulfomonile sp.]